jgi:hypothetical protein
MVVDVTVQKEGGKELNAVPLGFSLSGEGQRKSLNKIDLSLILSIKKKDKIKGVQVDVLFGCSCSMFRMSFLKDYQSEMLDTPPLHYLAGPD